MRSMQNATVTRMIVAVILCEVLSKCFLKIIVLRDI